jgi:hypothetical protein
LNPRSIILTHTPRSRFAEQSSWFIFFIFRAPDRDGLGGNETKDGFQRNLFSSGSLAVFI